MKQTLVTLVFASGLTAAAIPAKRYPELQDTLWSYAAVLGIPIVQQGIQWFFTQSPGDPGSAPGPSGFDRR